MLSIYFNTENSTKFSEKQQIKPKSKKETNTLFNFKTPKEKFYDFIPKFYTVNLDSIKENNYVLNYAKDDIEIDKKIGNTKQVKNDCWLLAGINALGVGKLGGCLRWLFGNSFDRHVYFR